MTATELLCELPKIKLESQTPSFINNENKSQGRTQYSLSVRDNDSVQRPREK